MFFCEYALGPLLLLLATQTTTALLKQIFGCKLRIFWKKKKLNFQMYSRKRDCRKLDGTSEMDIKRHNCHQVGGGCPFSRKKKVHTTMSNMRTTATIAVIFKLHLLGPFVLLFLPPHLHPILQLLLHTVHELKARKSDNLRTYYKLSLS